MVALRFTTFNECTVTTVSSVLGASFYKRVGGVFIGRQAFQPVLQRPIGVELGENGPEPLVSTSVLLVLFLPLQSWVRVPEMLLGSLVQILLPSSQKRTVFVPDGFHSGLEVINVLF